MSELTKAMNGTLAQRGFWRIQLRNDGLCNTAQFSIHLVPELAQDIIREVQTHADNLWCILQIFITLRANFVHAARPHDS